MSDDLTSILINFGVPIGYIGGANICTQIFLNATLNNLGQSPNCQFTNSTAGTVTVTLGLYNEMADYRALDFRPGVINDQLCISYF
jgi:hypothetical protein